MNLVPQQNSFLKDVTLLLQHAWDLDFNVTGGELYRTIEQQALHFASGRSKTMQSNHLQRLAIDLNFFKGGTQLTYNKEVLKPLGDYWCGLSPMNRWGGNWDFMDTTHFERLPE